MITNFIDAEMPFSDLIFKFILNLFQIYPDYLDFGFGLVGHPDAVLNNKYID